MLTVIERDKTTVKHPSMNKVQETMFQSLEGNQSRMVSGDNNSLLVKNNGRITIKLKIPRTEIVEEEEEENSHPLANGWTDYYINASPVVNLMESLKGWPVTGKRSRKSLVDKASVDAGRGQEVEVEVDEDMQEAASALLLLSQGPPKDFEGVSKKQQVEVSPDVYDFGTDCGRNFLSGALKIEGKRPTALINMGESEIQRSIMDKENKKVVLLESEFGSDKSTCLSYDWESIENHEDCTEVKRKKKRKLADPRASLDQICVISNRHTCTICNKSFPSHQALGGHKSSHKKPKKIQTVNESKSSLDAWATEYKKQVTKEAAGGSRAAAVSGVHICNICNEVFPTGMALGGHKRRHWAGPVEAPLSSSQETSCPTEVTHTACKVRSFDLNEPASEEEDDDQDIQLLFNQMN